MYIKNMSSPKVRLIVFIGKYIMVDQKSQKKGSWSKLFLFWNKLFLFCTNYSKISSDCSPLVPLVSSCVQFIPSLVNIASGSVQIKKSINRMCF